MAAFHQSARVDRIFYAGQEAAFVFGHGTQIFPCLPVEFIATTEARVVADGGKRWFEFGFRIDTNLTGNSGAGWTDPGLYVKLEIEWSSDVVVWNMGKFLPAPTPTVNLGDGTYEYWSRAINPADAAIKVGALIFAQFPEDTRNQPFTSMVIAGVAQALPNFPYAMPAGATQLQSDLRSRGWTGTIVTAASSATWLISIPGVNYSDYSQSSWVGFSSYLVPNMIGGLPIIIDRIKAAGAFVDAAGVPLFTKAFARLKISNGTRYL